MNREKLQFILEDAKKTKLQDNELRKIGKAAVLTPQVIIDILEAILYEEE